VVCAWGWLKVSVSWVGFVIPGRFIKLAIHGVCVALVWREFSVGAICCLRLVCGLARSPLSFKVGSNSMVLGLLQDLLRLG
jgi:hypothetical protein